MGQKQKTEREKERREKERPKVGSNNGQLQIATPPRVAHANPPGPTLGRGKLTHYNHYNHILVVCWIAFLIN